MTKPRKQEATAKAIGYARVSTAQQQREGLSLNAQRQSIEEHCRREGWELVEVFEDAASGRTLERPGLLALLGAVRRGYKVVAVKADRLSRETGDLLGLEVEIRGKGAELVVDGGAIDTDDPTAELLFTLKAALAKYERRLTAARTAWALASKKARGERAGTVGFGFKLVGDGSDRVEPDPVEQEALRVMGELQGAGYSLRQIADELNAQGYKTRRGSPWRFEYVRARVGRVEAGAA